MRFSSYLHLFSCALVAIGFSSIALSGAYVIYAGIGLLVTLIYIKSHRFIDTRLKIPTLLVNISIISLLLFSLYDIFFMSFDIVGNAIRFVIVLQIIKLLSSKTSRDWLQIYALSFLQLLSSTVLSESITFAIPFFIYLFFATWTLTLFNLKTQIENLNQEEDKEDSKTLRHLLNSKDVVRKRFFVSTAALCSGILIFTFIVFFSIPRVSFKNFLRRAAKPKDIAGFSKEVDLGTLGNIQGSSEIAFRVEIHNKKLTKKELALTYWRANSADQFDGKTWRSSRNKFKVVRMNLDNTEVFSNRRPPSKNPDYMKYTVSLESLDTPLLFLADHFVEASWDRSFLERFLRRTFMIRYYPESDSYEMHTSARYQSDLQYTAVSSVNMPSITRLQDNFNQDYPEDIKKLYLQLPELSEELTNYLDSIAYPNVSPFIKAFMAQEYLKKEYRYTLNIQDAGTKNPLDNFFLNTKAGHCEYFSTAMIVMLRYIGIPARQVMGFRGGEYNPYGNYVSVRQSDAHSWVEVYLPDFGWLRFDPTPANTSFKLPDNFIKPLLQFSDYLKLRWHRYIVDYNLKQQLSGLKSLSEKFSQAFAIFKQKQKQDQTIQNNTKDNSGQVFNPIIFLFIFIALLALLLLALIISRLRQQSSPYTLLLKKLKKMGFKKYPSETVDEFKLRVLEKHPELQQPLTQVNDYYINHRFGKKDFSLANWHFLIKNIKKGKR
ncbi:DUF3488 and transglutaminase-like domain-containing protein [bacterium]|nr:DUF3488 and transglutaminase-like domain-containing protein [bacterium]